MKAKFTNKAPWQKEYTTMEFDMTQEEFDVCLHKWMNGELIQRAFPKLNASEREFIMTGIGPEEWDNMFGPGEE